MGSLFMDAVAFKVVRQVPKDFSNNCRTTETIPSNYHQVTENEAELYYFTNPANPETGRFL